MENGAVYSPTTEEDPGPSRGARSGLAAHFSLGRLPLHRRVLKGLQLVSSRRRTEPGGKRGPAEGPRPAGWEPAKRLLSVQVQEASVSSPPSLPAPLGKGALPSASSRVSPGRPLPLVSFPLGP